MASIKDRLKRFLLGSPKKIKLGDQYVGLGEPVFVIAEIGLNHNGSFDRAKALIDAAKEAGVDCVKFQMRDIKSLYANKGTTNDIKENLTSQYTLDLLSKFQLPDEQMFKLFDYAREIGMFPLCTPWDLESLKKLEAYGMHTYKVASADLTNHDLIREIAKTKKPIICSTGMSQESEIVAVNNLLKKLNAKYILLHCNSTYPAPFQDINLQYMSRLGTALYGYSGHERGINIAIAAVARGAKIIEKHITFDRAMEGPDHKASLTPDEFKAMIEAIRQVEASLGTAKKRELTQGEKMNRANLAKSLVATRDIKKGDMITPEMIEVKSPGRGLQPDQKEKLINRKARRSLRQGDFFYLNDLLDKNFEPRSYVFSRPWGIPVRYYDYKELHKSTNPDLLEFHLSYNDLTEDISSHFPKPLAMDLVVHSPETFADDHLLNLASFDEAYWQRSIAELQKVVAITNELKKHFSKASKPLIVVNVGGFTKDKPLSKEERRVLYERIADGLASINQDGVEIIIQTMPPYPWLLGGQLFHNLFLDPDEIAAFCEKYKYRICFDTSHSKLACNTYGWDFSEFTKKILKYTAHLHVVDAKDVNGEGIQVEEGEIDFNELRKNLDSLGITCSFIPEIWQGHENGGEGFWIALERLEKYL